MRRACGIAFGVGTQLVFLLTVCRLFLFLRGEASPVGSLWWDVLLAGQFAVVHSLLLFPPVRARLEKPIGRPFYGCFYALATCGGLWVMFHFWRGSERPLWSLDGPLAVLVDGAFYGAWLALFYSLHLAGLGYQTGLTPWWHWLRGRAAPRREFVPRGVQLVMRHPVYLSFLGLVWLRPTVTLDRGVLLAVWTIYVLVGSVLKDRRMVHYLGQSYGEYQSRVAGYPGMLWGPLARAAKPNVSSSPSAVRRESAAVAERELTTTSA